MLNSSLSVCRSPHNVSNSDETSAINSLQSANLLAKNSNADDTQQSRLRQALEDLEVKEKEVIELRSRMDEYERNAYGLHDAVQEIKHYKTQLGIRDGEIAVMIKKANDINRLLNEAIDENLALRLKYGLPAHDASALSNYRATRDQELSKLRAENQTLLRENDALEEERLRMKKQLLLQSNHPSATGFEYFKRWMTSFLIYYVQICG